jgi:hypothetical protein
MKKIDISSTSNTPSVSFDPELGLFKIEGRSIPENPGEFFDGLIDWLILYFKEPASKTSFELNLEYVNSGSSKYLLSLFKVFKDAFIAGKNIEIRWLYEEDDEAIKSLGEHYKTILGIPFQLIEYI